MYSYNFPKSDLARQVVVCEAFPFEYVVRVWMPAGVTGVMVYMVFREYENDWFYLYWNTYTYTLYLPHMHTCIPACTDACTHTHTHTETNSYTMS